MKLIREEILNTSITEETIDEATGKKNLYIEGIFLQGEITNKNGRLYPGAVMESAVNAYTQRYINTGRAFGELSHPKGPQINLDRVSHIITELRKDGNNYIGKARIAEDTPMGAIAKGIITAGGQLGVSSRGLGSIKESNGVPTVQPDFVLATAADIVGDPSAPSAFVNGIYESADWAYNNGDFEKVVSEVKEEVEKDLRSGKEIYVAECNAFQSFMSKISKI